MGFPSDELRAVGGELSAHLFENPRVGVERGVYWGVRLDFARLQYEGDWFQCAMECEWIPWQIRDWRDLDGRSLKCRLEGEFAEASFYVFEHGLAESVDLSIRRVEGAEFEVSLSMIAEFEGWVGHDADPRLHVAGRARVPFEGVRFLPGHFDPAPHDADEALALAEPFLDLDAFSLEKTESGAWLLRPRVE